MNYANFFSLFWNLARFCLGTWLDFIWEPGFLSLKQGMWMIVK